MVIDNTKNLGIVMVIDNAVSHVETFLCIMAEKEYDAWGYPEGEPPGDKDNKSEDGKGNKNATPKQIGQWKGFGYGFLPPKSDVSPFPVKKPEKSKKEEPKVWKGWENFGKPKWPGGEKTEAAQSSVETEADKRKREAEERKQQEAKRREELLATFSPMEQNGLRFRRYVEQQTRYKDTMPDDMTEHRKRFVRPPKLPDF